VADLAISNSEIATADRCMRQWYLKYYLGTVPAEEIPVGSSMTGTRIHTALEGWYGYGLDPVDVLQALYALATEAFPDWSTELAAERELAVTMVKGYQEWVAETGEDANLRVVMTETDLEVPLPGVPGVSLKARMDQVVYDEANGWLSFLDHKTAANFDSHEKLAMKPQFKHYSVMQRMIQRDGRHDRVLISGGIVNTLRRVKRTEKSKPPYYQRDAFRFNDEQLDAAEERIYKLVDRILEARQALDWVYGDQQGALEAVNRVQRSECFPSPAYSGCAEWECPFTSVCPMMDDGSDWGGVLLRSGRYRQDDPYQYYRSDPLRAVRQVLGA
jgi:hypothetical protein